MSEETVPIPDTDTIPFEGAESLTNEDSQVEGQGTPPLTRAEYEEQVQALRAGFARQLRALHRRTVENIIEEGRLLIQAKRRIPHGQFTEVVEQDLGWTLDAAEKLMAVARNPVLTDSATLRNLPASREVLYQLARLPDETLRQAREMGAVTSTATMKAATGLVRLHKSGFSLQRTEGGDLIYVRRKPEGEPASVTRPVVKFKSWDDFDAFAELIGKRGLADTDEDTSTIWWEPPKF